MKKDWWSEEFGVMVALGESTTAGGGATSPDRSWVALLAHMINDYQSIPVEVFNVGIGANVISSRSPCYPFSRKPAANERLDKHVIAHRPDLVIISYGLNDARGGTPVDLFGDEMVALVRKIRDQTRSLIVLLGPYYIITGSAQSRERWRHVDLPLLHRVNDVCAEVTEEEECLFVDVLAANGGTNWMVHYDGVHANDLGHRIIACKVFEILAQNCSCLAKRTKELEKISPEWRDETMLQADYGYQLAGDLGYSAV